MSLESSLAYFAALFIFAITPGPGVMALVARSLSSGTRACFSLALGLTVSDIIYLTMAFYGLGTVAANWSGLFTVIRVVGGCYLLYLGWRMWTTEVDDVSRTVEPKSSRAGFIQGFLVSASNPKVILFYIAFLPTFMDLGKMTNVDLVILIGITLTGLMAGLMVVAFTGASARKALSSPRAVKRLNRVAGSVMVGAGAYLIGHE